MMIKKYWPGKKV